MHLTWYDNNSWLIEIGGQRILLDPWIVGTLVFGNLPWLFQGHHTEPRSLPDRIDLILLSQGLEDHAHPPTLQQLDRTIPVVASPNAAKVVRELGYTTVTELAHGESYILGDRVQIQATPGAPIGPFLVENGYLLTELETKLKLYYEPHGFHSPTLKAAAPVDVVITPLISLELPLMGALIQGDRSAPQLVDWLRPQVMLPTAAGGDVQFEGVLTKVIKQVGSIEAFKARLIEKQMPTRVLSPRPGDRFEPLAASASIN